MVEVATGDDDDDDADDVEVDGDDDGRTAKVLDLALLTNGHCARYTAGSVQYLLSQETYSPYLPLAEQKRRL